MAGFTSFILLAAMRTGSNYLEGNLNQIPGVRSWGEAFNPRFAGGAGRTELAGVTLAERKADPFRLLDAIRARTKGIAGFRFFDNHDPRVLEHCLADRDCAKLILTRDPLDSYVSLATARATGQWLVREGGVARTARITFDPEAYARYLADRERFRARVDRALQTTGQAAFRLAYEEAGDPDVLNGLARYLGSTGRVERFETRTRPQNPADLRAKVANYDEMVAFLAGRTRFDAAPGGAAP